MAVRDVYLKIETIHHYSPVEPEDHAGAPRKYGRDCMYNVGHEDGLIPAGEIEARSLSPLVYREYLDPGFSIPKPDKLIATDINEPIFEHRVPGTVIYCRPGERLRIQVLNWDTVPHSFHLHGLRHGIDSDGAWPFGTEAGSRRSDEICPGETWTYFFDVTEEMVGAWPFHDHYRRIDETVNRGLFGGVVVLPSADTPLPACAQLPRRIGELLKGLIARPLAIPGLGPRGGKAAAAPAEQRERSDGHSHDDGPAVRSIGGAVVAKHIEFLKEWAQLDYVHPRPSRDEVLHVPIFLHTMAGEKLSTPCINGRAFTGNTPTILATAGQCIRWYVFNLDVAGNWHSFHPHGQRWSVAGEAADTRSLGPVESFVVDTIAPPVLTLPEDIQKAQSPDRRPKDARPFDIRGDFLFHCGEVRDLTGGMVGIVRSRDRIWLTQAQADAMRAGCGLPVDDWGNGCPPVDPDHCETVGCGRWEEVPGDPEVAMMHAALLPKSEKIVFWGYTRADQSRIWDAATGAYSLPANQPADVAPIPGDIGTSNMWSSEHAYLDTPEGKLLVHGGFSPDQAYIFDPSTLSWARTGATADDRFYSTSMTLADGKILTLFGSGLNSIEVYDPSTGTWAAPIPVPPTFDYLYYPWTYLLPGGDLFTGGPTGVSRRFDWSAPVDDPARTWNTIAGNRSTGGEKGTSVLLPLRPPNYEPRVLIAGGNLPAAEQTAEVIDLSVPAPAWASLPNLNVARPEQFTAVLMPDSQVLIAGGTFAAADGGPSELLDTRDLPAGWRLCASMQQKRGYHSSNILLADGSVLMGGDPAGPGAPTPHERYLPWYFSKVRPVIDSAPTGVAWGETFTIDTAQGNDIEEVLFLRPGAVTHGFNMSQRYVELAITDNHATNVEVVAPPDGFIAPPGYYLLFIVNRRRVPSKGWWIRLSP
jgi:FtsP/CotA-like multicopper oxidase with cupredoxin domain